MQRSVDDQVEYQIRSYMKPKQKKMQAMLIKLQCQKVKQAEEY